MRKIRWDVAPRRVPKHPYRDSALLYGAFALLVVAVAAASGGNVWRAALIAAFLFLATTAYSWWRWRERIRRAESNR